MEENKQQPEVPKGAEEVKPPSMMSMIKSFGKDLSKWVKEGAPATSPADYIERLTACKNCPHLIEKHMRCGKCGCLVEHKAKWRTTTCPDDPQRWKPQDLKPKTNAERRHRDESLKAEADAVIERELLTKKRHETGDNAVTVTKEEIAAYKKEKEKEYTEFEDVPNSKDV